MEMNRTDMTGQPDFIPSMTTGVIRNPHADLPVGARVRYRNNDGDLTQFGRITCRLGIIGPSACECGVDRSDPRHESLRVAWDNGTRSTTSRCHLTPCCNRCSFEGVHPDDNCVRCGHTVGSRD